MKELINLDKWQKVGPVGLAAMLMAFAACGTEEDKPTPPNGNGQEWQLFECVEEKNGWEQCVDDRIQWCHGTSNPHFHWGANCGALGYECVRLTESSAACVDTSETCTVGESKCEGNTAYTCIAHDDHGHWAVEPCGTGRSCHMHDGVAECHAHEPEECNGHGHMHGDHCHCDPGYGYDGTDQTSCVLNPAAMCTLFATAADSVDVVDDFADWDDAHADLYTPTVVTLPAGTHSYVHFDVERAGEHVIFVDTVDVIDMVLNLDESPIENFDVHGPNGQCATAIPQHYHMELAIPAGDPAYVIRFTDALTEDTQVTFMVVTK